jgi:hypothetical protein
MVTHSRGEVCFEAKERHELSAKKAKIDPIIKSKNKSRRTAIYLRN